MGFVASLWAVAPKWLRIAASLGLLGLVISGVFYAGISMISKAHTSGIKVGVNQERVEAQTEVLVNVEKAHEVGDAIQRETSAGSGERLYAQCLRSTRTPENCKRFLPR